MKRKTKPIHIDEALHTELKTKASHKRIPLGEFTALIIRAGLRAKAEREFVGL